MLREEHDMPGLLRKEKYNLMRDNRLDEEGWRRGGRKMGVLKFLLPRYIAHG